MFPQETSYRQFCFTTSPGVSRDKVEGTSGNKTNCFPWDRTSSVYYFTFASKQLRREKSIRLQIFPFTKALKEAFDHEFFSSRSRNLNKSIFKVHMGLPGLGGGDVEALLSPPQGQTDDFVFLRVQDSWDNKTDCFQVKTKLLKFSSLCVHMIACLLTEFGQLIIMHRLCSCWSIHHFFPSSAQSIST